MTEDLINLVVEMYKLRLTVLKDFVEELFSFEDTGYIYDGERVYKSEYHYQKHFLQFL